MYEKALVRDTVSDVLMKKFPNNNEAKKVVSALETYGIIYFDQLMSMNDATISNLVNIGPARFKMIKAICRVEIPRILEWNAPAALPLKPKLQKPIETALLNMGALPLVAASIADTLATLQTFDGYPVGQPEDLLRMTHTEKELSEIFFPMDMVLLRRMKADVMGQINAWKTEPRETLECSIPGKDYALLYALGRRNLSAGIAELCRRYRKGDL